MFLGIKNDLKVKDFPVVKFVVEVPDDMAKVYPIEFLSKFFADWMTDGFIYLYIMGSANLANEFLKKAHQENFHLVCSLDD